MQDIGFLAVSESRFRDAGQLLRIELEDLRGRSHVIWLDAVYSQAACGILHELLELNREIRIHRDTGPCDFAAFEGRLLEPEDYARLSRSWAIETSRRKDFSDAQWRQLILAPVCLFFMVARADGRIQEKEVAMFTRLLGQAEHHASFFVAEVFRATHKQLEALIDSHTRMPQPDEALLEAVFLWRTRRMRLIGGLWPER